MSLVCVCVLLLFRRLFSWFVFLPVWLAIPMASHLIWTLEELRKLWENTEIQTIAKFPRNNRPI